MGQRVEAAHPLPGPGLPVSLRECHHKGVTVAAVLAVESGGLAELYRTAGGSVTVWLCQEGGWSGCWGAAAARALPGPWDLENKPFPRSLKPTME